MVFPQDGGNEIDTRVVMITHAIFEGIVKEEEDKKYFNLTPIILADIYRSLDETQKQELTKPKESSPLDHYELHLSIHKFKIHNTRKAWAQVLYDIREENIQWMFQNFVLEKVAI
ncbi:hypothetical protein KY285_010485 [Solanum tuberosum]|nr:hypothetical protein KY285_010485 [Solanum tuberosum]